MKVITGWQPKGVVRGPIVKDQKERVGTEKEERTQLGYGGGSKIGKLNRVGIALRLFKSSGSKGPI